MPKSISFDVIGTCFGFHEPIETIQRRLGHKISPVDPTTLFFSWFYCAQRDFTYASLCGTYKPIAEILKTTFRRACLVVDLPADIVSDEDIAEIMTAFKSMGPREGLKRCYDGLRDAGWDVYGVTNGGSETSLNYYRSAGIELDAEHLLSCDSLKIAKPDVRVYQNAKKVIAARGGEEEQQWFVAAHAWDVAAAREAGFKTAYLDFEEHDSVKEVFGEFNVYASSMDELLEEMKKIG